MLLLLFAVSSVFAQLPVSECPDATRLHYEWGRLLMFDLTDNGLLDASVVFGVTPEITNGLLLPYGTPPYMNLSPSGYLPRLCNLTKFNSTSGCSVDDLPCCGDPRCGENPIMQTLFTLLVREYNAFISKLDMKGAGHGPHMMQLGRNHIISILAATCPGCRAPLPICTAKVSTDLLSLLSYSSPNTPLDMCTNSAGILVCDATAGVFLQTPIVKIVPPNATIPGDGLNFTYYLQQTQTPEVLSLDAWIVAFFNSYFGVSHNATSLLVFLLSERHGPGEEDIIGRLGHALMNACFGIQNPVWINDAKVRKLITDFYTQTCPDECAVVETTSGTCDCNDNVEKGSLIFFVILLALLVIAIAAYVGYALVRI
jgi:hypothetical protein